VAVNLTPTQLLAGLAVLLVVGWLWRASVRRARAAADAARTGARVVSLAGRVVLTAAGIVGVQWIVITYAAANTVLLLVVLGVPALFAGHVLTRALTVTTLEHPSRGGRR
jgi:hypothetical protein